MKSILIVHPNVHIATGLADMLDGILEELYSTSTEVLTAGSIAEAINAVQSRGLSLMLIDGELLVNTTQPFSPQLPGEFRKRVLLVRDPLLIKSRKLVDQKMFGALLRMPIERERLKDLVRLSLSGSACLTSDT
jgi:hypothetical protein